MLGSIATPRAAGIPALAARWPIGQTRRMSDDIASAEAALASKDYRTAHARCMAALARDPGNATAFFLLGVIAEEHGNFGKALEVFERALRLDDAAARVHAHRARCLVSLSRPLAAVEAADRATQLEPADPLTLDTIGVVYSRTGYHDRAIPLFGRASAQAPENASYAYNLASSQQFQGAFEAAERNYRRAIALDPDHHRAYGSLVQLYRASAERNDLEALGAAFTRLAARPEAALNLGHALAKQHEDLGDYVTAFDWLIRAKAGRKAALSYDSAQDRALFAAAAATVEAGFDPNRGFPTEEPIFIVGLPRTGTTLVDRILGSHPAVFAAGELTNFAMAVKGATRTPSNRVLDEATLAAADAIDRAQLGRAYLESSRPRTGHHPRFTDKMPLNFFYAGLIAATLPNARIVCLRRDPMDAALSNFRQRFGTGYSYYNYAYDLEDTGRYYAMFDALIAIWRSHLPPQRFLEVHYERLVADQESESRRLVAFCGLDWDPACLAFHRNAAPVATASSVQVRSPIYATSIGRWKHYGDRLEPLKRVLESELGTSVG